MFTLENTNGYTQSELDYLNHNLDDNISHLDSSDIHYDSELKSIAKKCIDKYEAVNVK